MVMKEMENVTKLHMQSKNGGWELYEGSSTKEAQEPLYIAEKGDSDDDNCCIKFTDRSSTVIARSSMPKMLAKRDSHITLFLGTENYTLNKQAWWKTQRNFTSCDGIDCSVIRVVRGFLQIVNSLNNHVLATFTYSHWSKKKLGVIRLYSAENLSDADKVLFTLVLSIMAKLERQRQLEVVL
ncbi:hypothetical protein E3P99_02000 [Wallemia hederae]|uniref:Uncharacterized protein n=1 Tax=Wallemia hederae TaxID=1540922 RepID=A0A4T0FPQ7_9BASI|nr:hypothetical protein E3P99_02000 [Wallemia hederae]